MESGWQARLGTVRKQSRKSSEWKKEVRVMGEVREGCLMKRFGVGGKKRS